MVAFKQASKAKPPQPCSAVLQVPHRHTQKETQSTQWKHWRPWHENREVWKEGDGDLSWHVQLPGSSRVWWGGTSPSMLLQVRAGVSTLLRCFFKVFQFLWSFLPSCFSSLAGHGCKLSLSLQTSMGPALLQAPLLALLQAFT